MKYLAGFIAGVLAAFVAMIVLSDPYVSYPIDGGTETPIWKYN